MFKLLKRFLNWFTEPSIIEAGRGKGIRKVYPSKPWPAPPPRKPSVD